MARRAHPNPPIFDLVDGPGPLRARIVESVLVHIRSGVLAPGDPVPSSRTMAGLLGVGRSAVVEAYDELIAAGQVYALAGSGTYVGDGAGQLIAASTMPRAGGARRPQPAPHLQLQPGLPDSSLLDAAEWRRAWRSAAATSVPGDYPFGDGHPELSAALATHLRMHRGVLAEPSDIVVVPGVSAAVTALAVAGSWSGLMVAVEDPGHLAVRSALRRAGAVLSPTPVDDEGLIVSRLDPRAGVAYVTPSHQYPLGGRMGATRRAELMAWARANGAVVVEDDYDSEFRFDVAPQPALRAEADAAEYVAYFGTASKVLTPALRCAWLIPPPRLREAVLDAVRASYLCVDRMASRAVARLLSSGAWSRHVARSSRVYADRRAALVGALSDALPGYQIVGVEAGLHLVLRLPEDCDDTAVSARLERAGIQAPTLSGFGFDAGSHARPLARGLVLSYARLPAGSAVPVATAVAAALG